MPGSTLTGSTTSVSALLFLVTNVASLAVIIPS